MLLHPLAQRRRIAAVVLLERRHVGRRRRRGRTEQGLQHPLPAQHDRGPVGVRRDGEQARVAQQPVTPVVGPLRAAEPAAVDAGNPVVPGELLVQVRVVRPEQLRNRPVLAHLALEEQLRLAHHRGPQRIVESGEQRAVGILRVDVADLQPLPDEVVQEPRGAAIGEHAPDLVGEDSRIAEAAARGQVEQFVVRDALPEEEGQAGGQLEIAQTVDGAGPRIHRMPLDAQQEARHRQQGFERSLDPGLEVARGATLPVDRQQRLDVGLVHRPPVGAARQRPEDLARARLLGRGRGVAWTAREDASAARCVLGHGPVERPGDIEHVDAGQLDRHVGGGRRVGEAGGDQPGAGVDPHADLQLLVSRHPVFVEPLPLDVILRHRDQHPRIRPREPAANPESPDQLVIDAQLDLVLVLGDAVYGLDRLVALEPNREDVLPVERERVAHGQPAVRGERHVLIAPDVAPLVADLVDLHDRPVVGTADRGAADLRGGGDVARHQGRRDRQHVGVVVEAEAGHVARQQRLAVGLQGQQILDGVDVLQPVQPPRRHPARVGVVRGGAVERGFERRREGVDGGGVGARPALRRHLPATQLADDPLEDLGVRVHPADVQSVEHQAGRLESLVVAGDAVAVEQLARRRLRGRPLPGDRAVTGAGGRGVDPGDLCEDARRQRDSEPSREAHGQARFHVGSSVYRRPAGNLVRQLSPGDPPVFPRPADRVGSATGANWRRSGCRPKPGREPTGRPTVL